MKLRLIGDIHANFNEYLRIISDCENSVQVGDYGIGFRENPIFGERAKKHRFIRGNHDNPDLCKSEPNWIPDGHFEDGIFYIGGADSIDKMFRTPGMDWWPNEQLSHYELDACVEKYKECKPDIVISHEIPNFVTKYFGVPIFESIGDRTRPYLEEMWKTHQPKLWLCGHWHFSKDIFIDKTRFLVLNINQFIDIETEGTCHEEQPLYKII